MKYITQTIILTIFSLIVKGQTLTVPLFIDNKFIMSTVDSLHKSNVSEIIIFQTNRPFQYLKSNDSLLTFICWKNAGLYLVKILTENEIFSTIDFKGEKIFSYKNKLKTLVSNDEQKLKFIPPLTNNNAVFYFSSDIIGYFEQPDKLNSTPITYQPTDKFKEKMRIEWFNIIYQTLLKENFNFKIKSNYDRYKEPE